MNHFTIVGPIDEVMLKKFYKFVKKQEHEADVCLSISSGGGDSDVALAIVGIMKTTNLNWTTQAFGYLYSAASLIFCAGKVRRFSKAGFAMIHEGSDKITGDASTIKRHAKHMERYEEHWNKLMEEFTGTPASVWAKHSERDTYFNADECLKLGIATEII